MADKTSYGPCLPLVSEESEDVAAIISGRRQGHFSLVRGFIRDGLAQSVLALSWCRKQHIFKLTPSSQKLQFTTHRIQIDIGH